MQTQAQKDMTAVAEELKHLQGDAEAAKGWTPELSDKYKAAVERGKMLAAQIDREKEAEALKSWGDAPDGQSAAKLGWSRESLPEEGNLPGVAEDYVTEKRWGRDGKAYFVKVPTGQLYDISALGVDALKALRNPLYKSAMREYIKSAFDRNAMSNEAVKTIKQTQDAVKVMQEGLGTSGELWIPPDMKPQVVQKMATVTGVSNDCYHYTTGSNIVRWPAQVYSTDDKYTNGIRPTPESQAPSSDYSEATNPAAGAIEIPIITYVAPIIVTRSMIEDNLFDLLGYISSAMGESFKLYMNDLAINGTGAGQAQGIINYPDASTLYTSVNATTGHYGMYVISGTDAKITWAGATNTTPLTTQGVRGVEAALPPQYEAGAKWYGSKRTFAEIGNLVDTTARPLWLENQQFSNWVNGEKQPANLLGYPVVKDQFMPELASQTLPLMLGDLQGYHMPERVGLSIQVLYEVKAMRGEVVVLGRYRFGGKMVRPWQVKLLKAYTS